MAQRFFCDVCSEPCPAQATRRWELIIGELGLEVVILKHNKPVGDTHLCDDCIFKMFWMMLERNPQSQIKKLKDDLLREKIDCKKLEEELENKRKDADALLEDISRKLKDIEKQEDEIKKVKKLLLDRQLAGPINNVTAELIRQAEQRGYQRRIDEVENPEYIQAIEMRNFKVSKGF